jgi:hypothetical protein
MIGIRRLCTICALSLLLLPPFAFAESDGRIEAPRGQVPAGRVTVKGTLSKMSDGERYWLVVRRGKLLFPKSRIRAEAAWEATIEEPSPPGERFSIVLFAVTPRGDQQLQAWLSAGQFVGLTEIAGAEELDAVDLKAR